MPLVSGETQLSPGDLGARIEEGRLLIPPKLRHVMLAQGIVTAAELLSYVISFPTSVGILLGWTPADVERAARTLSAQLEGRVPPQSEDLEPTVRFGARRPEGA